MGTLLTEPRMKSPDLLLRELVELRERVVAEGDELVAQWRPALTHQAKKTSRLVRKGETT